MELGIEHLIVLLSDTILVGKIKESIEKYSLDEAAKDLNAIMQTRKNHLEIAKTIVN